MKTTEIIQKYIPPYSELYPVYITHVTLVTALALSAARRNHLPDKSCGFIEEAGRLHDIGVVMVYAPEIGCHGREPYICHGVLGRKIMEEEGYPEHALVCERHVGVGISKEEIIRKNLPLPVRDMRPVTTEEKILAWADLFYRKTPSSLWRMLSTEEIRNQLEKYGPSAISIFNEWNETYGPVNGQ